MSYALANPVSTPPGLSPAQTTQLVWHGANDIQQLLGVVGTFYWPENPFRPAMMNFIFSAEAFGYYTLSAFDGTTLDDGYWVPSGEPGPASINLTSLRGAPSRSYQVQGMLTDANWKIYLMLLSGERSFFIPFRMA